MIAVSAAPKRIPIMGLEKEIISWANQGSFSRNFIESPIMSIPVISAKKPSRIVPMPLSLSLLRNI